MTNVVSFRLTPEELSLLQSHQLPGESLNLAAKRLMMAALGAKSDNPFDSAIALSLKEGRIKEALDEHYSSMADQVNLVFDQLQQLEKIVEQLKTPTTTTPTTRKAGRPKKQV